MARRAAQRGPSWFRIPSTAPLECVLDVLTFFASCTSFFPSFPDSPPPVSSGVGSLPLILAHTSFPNFFATSLPANAPSQSTVPSLLKYTLEFNPARPPSSLKPSLKPIPTLLSVSGCSSAGLLLLNFAVTPSLARCNLFPSDRTSSVVNITLPMPSLGSALSVVGSASSSYSSGSKQPLWPHISSYLASNVSINAS